jgi:hypothetical protein
MNLDQQKRQQLNELFALNRRVMKAYLLKESLERSTAKSKPFLEGAAATKISPTYCLRHSAWRSQKQNLSFFRKQPEMRVSTNSCAEPISFWIGCAVRPCNGNGFSRRETGIVG